MNPLFSIIIAVYNNEKYIVPAVESVINQEVKDVEIIIIDDGSTDGTPQIVDDLESKYDNVRGIHQENAWIYASFNRGIQEAKGEYIYILNSDDKLAEGALGKIKNSIVKNNYPDVMWTKVAVCKCDVNQEIITKTDARPVIDREYIWSGEENKTVWEKLITSDIMIDQANAYKREIMQRHAFRNDVYGADHLFNLEIAKDIKSFVIMPDEIYLFHVYENGSNTSIGKYYGYEHEMFNEFYLRGKDLLEYQNIKTDKNIRFLTSRRKTNYSIELKSYLKYGNDSLTHKIDEIFNSSIDKVILEVFNDREELDSRILSALRSQLVEEILDRDSEYYFVYKMLESLLRYEKDESDYLEIRDAVYDEKNPQHIGEIFYKRLLANR